MKPQQASSISAMVIRASRRWVTLRDAQGQVLEARSSTRALDATVGDQVICEQSDSDLVIKEIEPRRNQLERKNLARSKVFAANVDHLYIVTSVGPLFNTAFIDRALVAAADQEIPATLLLNKIDSDEEIPAEVAYYESISLNILKTSVRRGDGIEQLRKNLESESANLIVFCGLSGVGKSSLLNTLVPESKRDTGSVSERTGQGKQTTTQAEAFPFERPGTQDLLIVDLPGFSQFGMIHIPADRLPLAYPEFLSVRHECAFADCSHIDEPVCGVKARLERGEIDPFRYQSYLEIRDEIKCARSY